MQNISYQINFSHQIYFWKTEIFSNNWKDNLNSMRNERLFFRIPSTIMKLKILLNGLTINIKINLHIPFKLVTNIPILTFQKIFVIQLLKFI